MKSELLEKAVKDLSDVLLPVMDLSYTIPTPDKQKVLAVAMETNRRLGYDLFEDLYYPRLVHDFALVSRAVAHNALHDKKGGKKHV